MIFEYLMNINKNELLMNILDKTIDTVIILVLGFFVIKVINEIVKHIFLKTKFEETLEQFFQSLFAWFLWIILVLILLRHLGVNTTPILASLSIAGFITGFALKDILGNLAAGLMILATKPFKVGDFVKSGNIEGRIVRIGTAATVIKTGDNLKVTVPNSTLWGNPIIDYSSYDKRRIEISLGISYNENIDKVIKKLDEIVKNREKLLKDPEPSFNLSELGDYTYNIQVWVWTKRKDFFEAKHNLNKAIKESFEKANIVMPNPSMDIYMKK